MILNKAEFEQIERTIQEIENKTTGEIVVAFVGRSHGYGEFRAAFVACWTLAIVWAAHYLWPQLHATTLLLLQVPMALALWPLSGVGALLRWVLPKSIAEAAVQQRALRMFVERNVHHTRNGSGLLIMLSLLEHRVVILGDSGIHQYLQAEGWQPYVQDIVTGMRQKQLLSALLGVLKRLGLVLEAHFPKQLEDANELSDLPTYTER
jgi:putative membrane protein